jgi:hypothetical protein
MTPEEIQNRLLVGDVRGALDGLERHELEVLNGFVIIHHLDSHIS